MYIKNDMKNIVSTVVIIFNICLLLIYLFSIDIYTNVLKLTLILLVLWSALAFLSLRFSGRWARKLQDSQFSLFAVIIVFCLLESLKLCPGLLPLQVRNYLQESNINKVRDAVVEYLPDSPYVKFKPNVVVTSQGYRGNDSQFVYKWKTDSLGFKNNLSLAGSGKFDIVALGDSFTEGMGVAIEDTWPSMLNKAGIKTYNLGVQGYALTQMVGSLRLYGIDKEPRYIIIGYKSTIYAREKAFLNLGGSLKNKRFTGGISSSAEMELRKQTKHVTTAIYLLVSKALKDKRKKVEASAGIRDNNLYENYKYEIEGASREVNDPDVILKTPEFNSCQKAFLGIKRIADTKMAMVICIYFPSRGSVYYERATSKKFPVHAFERVESKLLSDFCLENGIAYLDLTNRFIEFINRIAENAPLSAYPYLEIDGHLSAVGHGICAEAIRDYLKFNVKAVD